jgi:hypothetical protein
MSWEIVKSETEPCQCGAGTVTYTMEMDDWNRTRSHSEIHCSSCHDKDLQNQEAIWVHEKQHQDLYSEAKRIAADRYLGTWLALYSGLTKKEAWSRYTGGSGYPALGTFYKHVKDSDGLAEYMRWCFFNDFEKPLRSMAIKDGAIEALLIEREGQ